MTTSVYIEDQMLFYTAMLPFAEAMNYNGIPALFRFVPKSEDRDYRGCVTVQCAQCNTSIDGSVATGIIAVQYVRGCYRVALLRA